MTVFRSATGWLNCQIEPLFALDFKSEFKGIRWDAIKLPAHMALAFYDSYRSERLPANLLPAQRDYFGAHTYERVDQPRGQFPHTNWTGHGGTTASSTYTV